jgi:hypothetical protein
MTPPEATAAWIANMGPVPVHPREIKFGFPNEHMMGSGAYRACWEGILEIGISPNYDFFIWRADASYNPSLGSQYPSLDNPYATKVTRVNCDGLLHALALIHHLLDQHNIPLTQRGNL